MMGRLLIFLFLGGNYSKQDTSFSNLEMMTSWKFFSEKECSFLSAAPIRTFEQSRTVLLPKGVVGTKRKQKSGMYWLLSSVLPTSPCPSHSVAAALAWHPEGAGSPRIWITALDSQGHTPRYRQWDLQRHNGSFNCTFWQCYVVHK